VVDGEDLVLAVGGDPALASHQSRVVDQHVDPLQRAQAVRERADCPIEARSATSSRIAGPPGAATSAATASPRPRSRPTRITCAPRPAKAAAVALPIPDVAPVTTQTSPLMAKG
jgi:hypothetical protein